MSSRQQATTNSFVIQRATRQVEAADIEQLLVVVDVPDAEVSGSGFSSKKSLPRLMTIKSQRRYEPDTGHNDIQRGIFFFDE